MYFVPTPTAAGNTSETEAIVDSAVVGEKGEGRDSVAASRAESHAHVTRHKFTFTGTIVPLLYCNTSI
jgi:hypothetical protein